MSRTAAAVSLAAFLTCCTPDTTDDEITLEEVWVQELPAEVGVPTGAAIRGDTVLVWSAPESVALGVSPSSLVRIGLPGTAPIAARSQGDQIFVLESDPPMAVQLDIDGRKRSRVALPIAGSLHSARWLDSAWSVVARDDAGFALYNIETSAEIA